MRRKKKEEIEGAKRKKNGEEDGREVQKRRDGTDARRKEKMARKKWRGCRRVPLLVIEFFSVMREGEASERRRKKKLREVRERKMEKKMEERCRKGETGRMRDGKRRWRGRSGEAADVCLSS